MGDETEFRERRIGQFLALLFSMSRLKRQDAIVLGVVQSQKLVNPQRSKQSVGLRSGGRLAQALHRLLAEGFKKDNPYRYREVQASGPVCHWDGEAAFGMGRQETLGKSFSFPTKDERIAGLEFCLIIRGLGLCG